MKGPKQEFFRGSEIVFELYNAKSDYFIRVLWGGQPMKTSTPLGMLSMIPLEDFFNCKSEFISKSLLNKDSDIDTTVGSSKNLITRCKSF